MQAATRMLQQVHRSSRRKPESPLAHVRLKADVAPKTAANFLALCEELVPNGYKGSR